jgi:hypothetical protein
LKLLRQLFNGRKNSKHIRPSRYKPTEIEWQFLKAIRDSTNFDFNQVTVNYNNQFGKHVHRNQGESLIMLVGDFKRGTLCSESGTRIEERDTWKRFDGSIPHLVESFKGERFSIVLYRK